MEHNWATILTNPIISEISFLWRHHFSTLFSVLIMDDAEVVRIVESTVTKKNENFLASKSLLDDSLNKLKRLQA